MDQDVIVTAVIALAALASVFFTVVPLVPGTLFIPAAAIVCAFLQGWADFAWWFWLTQIVLVVTYIVVDNLAQLFGVRRIGGSRAAMVGGAIGVFAGPIALGLLLGPLAIFVGPPIGAVVGTLVGEYHARRRGPSSRAGVPPSAASAPPAGYARLGIGALVAFLLGTTLKLVIVVVQVALLVWVV